MKSGFTGGLIIHTLLVFTLNRYYSYIHYRMIEGIAERLMQDYTELICLFLGNTQWLIRFFRVFGAHIGENVIIPDASCLTDYHLITVGNDVRLNKHVQIQVNYNFFTICI